MKRFIAVMLTGITSMLSAQVGINTPNPLANLEVRRSSLATIPDGIIPPRVSADSLQMKENLYGPAHNGALIYVTQPVTRSSHKMQNVTSEGYYVYDAKYTHADRSQGVWKKMFSDTHAFAWSYSGQPNYSARKLRTSGTDVELLRFVASDSTIGADYIVDDQYIVRESGLYAIDYSLRFEVDEAVYVTKRPSIIILKTTNNHEIQNLLASKSFDGINFGGGKGGFVITPSAGIHHIYHLNEGDRLGFGFVGNGKSIASMGDVNSEISIFKIR